jgi:hypothetical protein
MHDPVKVLNVYGYDTCGDDSICLAGLWHAGPEPHLLGRDLAGVLRRTMAAHGRSDPFSYCATTRPSPPEQDLARPRSDQRSHPFGILDPDRRTDREEHAALFTFEEDRSADPRSPASPARPR